MYKLQSTEDSSTWLVVRICSAEDGHSSIQQGAGNQRCSQTTGADKNILKQWLPTQQVQGALQQSLDGKKGTSESFESAQLRCQGYTDGNQLVVDLVEHYEPCMSPSLSQGLPL